MTLLVLPLADLAGTLRQGDDVWSVVQGHAGEFLAFLLSFVVIARLWVAQLRIVRGALEADRPLVGVMLAWTLTIVFLPFPTSLLAEVGDQAATKVLYIGTLAVSSLLLALLATLVDRQLGPDTPWRPRRSVLLVDAAAFVLALVLCLLVPSLSYYPLLLLFVAGLVERFAGRVRRRRVDRRA